MVTSVMSHAQRRCTHATLRPSSAFQRTPSGGIQDSSDKALSSVGAKYASGAPQGCPLSLEDALYYHQAPVCMHPCARGYINKQL